eukprot:3860182-Alexandrium_andersonii.AAC.1
MEAPGPDQTCRPPRARRRSRGPATGCPQGEPYRRYPGRPTDAPRCHGRAGNSVPGVGSGPGHL